MQVSPGNGDYGGGSFSRFRAQWAMPGWDDPEGYALHLCHSFDIGRAHIVGINTELLEYVTLSSFASTLLGLQSTLALLPCVNGTRVVIKSNARGLSLCVAFLHSFPECLSVCAE